MAAVLRLVPQKDWEILEKYLSGHERCVLIPEILVESLPQKHQEHLQESDCGLVDYDYGGEADVWVDMVRSPDAYFLKGFFEEETDYELDCDDACYGCDRSCADRIEPSL